MASSYSLSGGGGGRGSSSSPGKVRRPSSAPSSPSKGPAVVKAFDVKAPVRDVVADEWFRNMTRKNKKELNLENIAAYQEPNVGEDDEESEGKARIRVLRPSSPRSLNIMLKLGIEPTELAYHPPSFFEGIGVPPAVARQQYEFFESRRRKRMNEALKEYYGEIERQKRNQKAAQENFGFDPSAAGTKKKKNTEPDAGTLALLEEEKRRTEVLKARSEKELAQMIEHERERKETHERMEAKAANMRERVRRHEQERLRKQEAYRRKQFELDMRRKRQEEEERIAEREFARRQFEEDRRRKEMEQQREEELKIAAREKDEIRKAKAIQSRKRTEAILKQQAAAVEEAKLAREQREMAREQRLEEENRERAEVNRLQREKAEARIRKGLEKAEKMEEERKQRFLGKMQKAVERTEEIERQKEAAIKQHKREVEQLEEKRRAKLEQARTQDLEHRDNLKMNLDTRAEKTDRYMRRKAFSARGRMVERRLNQKDKEFKVAAHERSLAFQRLMNLQRIEESNMNTKKLLDQREKVIQMRRLSNIEASMAREKLKEEIARMQSAQMRALSLAGGGASAPAEDE